nr:immunoglobulin heavy chain junction region [Macaca mulatta]MOW91945.1 immunoglobulin heavy chain junction region [Macaca mulatta]
CAHYEYINFGPFDFW